MTRRDKAMCMLLIFTCVNNEDVHVRLICKNSKKKVAIYSYMYTTKITNLNSKLSSLTDCPPMN